MNRVLNKPALFRSSVILHRLLSTNQESAVSAYNNRLRIAEEKYACDFSTPLSSNVSAVLKSVAQETAHTIPLSHMMVQEAQAKFLSQMVRILKPASVLDIGTFTGTSTIVMASALCGDGKIVSLDVDAKAQAIARRNIEKLQLQDRVDLRLGSALESLTDLSNEKPRLQFDLVFIDANKEGYISYFDLIMDRNLLSDRGVILADNVLYFGLVHRDAGYEEECPLEVSERFRERSRSVAKFNQHVLRDPRVEVTMIPLFDGVSFIRKKD